MSRVDSSERSDYALLKRRIRHAGLLRKQPWYYALCISANLSILGLCLVLLVLVRNNPWLGPWAALLVVTLHKASTGIYMATVFGPNDKGMPQIDGTTRLDFLRKQVLTARNLRSGVATDLWYGSLNYQIEHHLFRSA
ncbi:MAG TPA: fatty acid desaturase [Candidatus Sulfotelmatobacter sp.]|nr:fatty acid desaturase [Candidatus Sulfotelmatobacter sp.]